MHDCCFVRHSLTYGFAVERGQAGNLPHDKTACSEFAGNLELCSCCTELLS
jgi:hypothetical protein